LWFKADPSKKHETLSGKQQKQKGVGRDSSGKVKVFA
jgi:hypothetical protein